MREWRLRKVSLLTQPTGIYTKAWVSPSQGGNTVVLVLQKGN